MIYLNHTRAHMFTFWKMRARLERTFNGSIFRIPSLHIGIKARVNTIATSEQVNEYRVIFEDDDFDAKTMISMKSKKTMYVEVSLLYRLYYVSLVLQYFFAFVASPSLSSHRYHCFE